MLTCEIFKGYFLWNLRLKIAPGQPETCVLSRWWTAQSKESGRGRSTQDGSKNKGGARHPSLPHI